VTSAFQIRRPARQPDRVAELADRQVFDGREGRAVMIVEDEPGDFVRLVGWIIWK
jgi:hypothetical protein